MNLDESIKAKIESMRKHAMLKDKETPKTKEKEAKPKTKRKRSWAWVRGIANSTKNPPNQAYWKRALELHESGLSDVEVNAILKTEKEG